MADTSVLHISCPANEKSAWLASARVEGQSLETWVRNHLNSVSVDTAPDWLSGLSERTRIGLLSAGYRSRKEVYDALSDPGVDLTKLPNFGKRCLRELKDWFGLSVNE